MIFTTIVPVLLSTTLTGKMTVSRNPTRRQIIYEMHVRSFSRHPSSGVKHPGTLLPSGKIYLKELGVNCVELMPVYEFDELKTAAPTRKRGNVVKLLGLQYSWLLCKGWLRSYRQTGDAGG